MYSKDVTAQNPWFIQESDLSAATTAAHETQFALANGYRSLRGESPFCPAQYPGAFYAGLYDKSEAAVTELVVCPNPLSFRVYVDYDEVLVGKKGASQYTRVLDMAQGVVSSWLTYQAETGSRLTMKSDRYVSRANRHRWAERWEFRADNFSRRIIIKIAIDGTVLNNAQHPLDAVKHLEVTDRGRLDVGAVSGIFLHARTRDSGVPIHEGEVLLCPDGEDSLKLLLCRPLAERVEAVYELHLEQGKPLVLYRLGFGQAVLGKANTEIGLKEGLSDFISSGYEAELSAHRTVLAQFWEDADIQISGDDRAQRALRFNLFHLSACANPLDNRVSIGAKGLHGEGYKGHVFWDTETFMLPFFIFTQPKTARSLLSYRYNTLQGARENARQGGHKGARFPWESADTGVEVTPPWGVDYAGHLVRIWTGEQEVHINADITYAVLKYLQMSGDRPFLLEQGLQILLETAQFWASFAQWNPERQRYEIRNVIGPDEFHEHVHNNTYTNYLAAWALQKTRDLVHQLETEEPDSLKNILDRAWVTRTEVESWMEVAEKLYIPMDKERGLFEQFEGYFKLQDIPITEWDKNGMPLWPKNLDLRRLNETQLIKQPDVVMLFAMIGEEFSQEVKIKNYEYYEKRTMHKSSLSPSIYAMVGLGLGKHDHAYEYFIKAAETDIVDNQGNTSHGLHAANAGGTWQSAVFGFGGLSIDRDGTVRIEPWLPPHWNKLRYSFYWRSVRLIVEVQQELCKVFSDTPLNIRSGDREYRASQEGVEIPRKI